jgi:hypothetical protein
MLRFHPHRLAPLVTHQLLTVATVQGLPGISTDFTQRWACQSPNNVQAVLYIILGYKAFVLLVATVVTFRTRKVGTTLCSELAGLHGLLCKVWRWRKSILLHLFHRICNV